MKEKIKHFLLTLLKLYRAIILVIITILFPFAAFGFFIITLFSSVSFLIGLLRIFVIIPIILALGIMACKRASTLGIWNKIYNSIKDW